MGDHARRPIVARLGLALTAIGAAEAARGLKRLTSLLRFSDDEGLRSLILRYCRDYDLDPVWILTGNGSPPLAEGSPPELTPVYAMTSVHPRTGQWLAQEIERIALAPAMLAPSRFVTRMDSRVLEPRIRLGAYLVVDTAEDRVPDEAGSGQVFAVDVAGEGLVVRQARRDREGGRLELTGFTPEHLPFSVPCGAPDSRVVGRVVWVAQML